MKLNTFLLIAAILYGLFGLGGLLAPAQVMAGMGVTLNEGGQLVARTGGAAAIGYAVIFLLARRAESAAAVRPILLGNVVYIALEIIAIVYGAVTGGMSPSGLPGVIVDVLLLAGFAYYAFKS